MNEPKKPRLEAEQGGDDADQGVLKAMEGLESLQDELDKVNDEASEKVLQLEQQYNKQRKPIYARRGQMIAKIPEFWKTAFLNHPVLSDLITEDDEEALFFLAEVMVDDSEDIKSGFKITFRFNANPYFEDGELQKSLTFAEDGTLQVDGTPPNWKDGMGPSQNYTVQDGKRGREHVYSFFQWFVESGTLDSGHQDEIAAIIKDEIWPNPYKFYQNDLEDFDGFNVGPDPEVFDEDEEGDEDDFDEGYDEAECPDGRGPNSVPPPAGGVPREYEQDDEDGEDEEEEDEREG
ncbi:unnamed protein product [Ostreobium quekettii]|uniref:Uncharacterized protein n=1 Tax=Ostreobium quekettii TaxID=121088 RepID=A0A8S1ISK7_9CHLO|nr:unnamed protein product [Ostreobium quekettii]|eukprot:evm.model.scf_1201.2 EVM.evm.TU.scf_1201.2   scf_1201:10292-14513(-)